MTNRIARLALLALVIAAPMDLAEARTRYDGAWRLLIVTQRGSCDRTYNFAVRINNGIVTFPGFVRARGRVTSGGHVRVAISAGGKYASGSGRISRNNAASGRWSGRSGSGRCSGYWTARRA